MSANKPSIGLVVPEIKFDSLETTLEKIDFSKPQRKY